MAACLDAALEAGTCAVGGAPVLACGGVGSSTHPVTGTWLPQVGQATTASPLKPTSSESSISIGWEHWEQVKFMAVMGIQISALAVKQKSDWKVAAVGSEQESFLSDFLVGRIHPLPGTLHPEADRK